MDDVLPPAMSPGRIRVLIQVAAGSRERRVYDETTLAFLHVRLEATEYPYPYGFVVGTRAADGDGVDCYVITRAPLRVGGIAECEAIGLLCQDEDGEPDHKILAALPGEGVDLSDALLGKLQSFIGSIFGNYPGGHVTVGPILPRDAALALLREAGDR